MYGHSESSLTQCSSAFCLLKAWTCMLKLPANAKTTLYWPSKNFNCQQWCRKTKWKSFLNSFKMFFNLFPKIDGIFRSWNSFFSNRALRTNKLWKYRLWLMPASQVLQNSFGHLNWSSLILYWKFLIKFRNYSSCQKRRSLSYPMSSIRFVSLSCLVGEIWRYWHRNRNCCWTL